MSHKATKLAWKIAEACHGARLVLLSLAEHHNGKTGLCCPSVARLVECTRLERKAVLRAIAELEQMGLIGARRKNGCGSRYTLHFLDQSQNGTGDKTGPVKKRASTSPKMGRDRSQKVTRNQERTGKESGSGSSYETANPSPSALAPTSAVVMPPIKKNALAGGQAFTAGSFDLRFEEFLREYPKQVPEDRKDKVWNVWRRLVATPGTDIEILADVRFRKTTEDWKKDFGRYVPAPDRYLEGVKWLDPQALLLRLTDEIERHPGNSDSIFHDPHANPEVIAEFQAKRTRLRALEKGKS